MLPSGTKIRFAILEDYQITGDSYNQKRLDKTWLVRELARRSNLALPEVNRERDPEQARLFQATGGRWSEPVAAKRALKLLAEARLCTLIPHTAANGLPLAAEQNERHRKAALLDVGLAHGLWNTPASTLPLSLL